MLIVRISMEPLMMGGWPYPIPSGNKQIAKENYKFPDDLPIIFFMAKLGMHEYTM